MSLATVVDLFYVLSAVLVLWWVYFGGRDGGESRELRRSCADGAQPDYHPVSEGVRLPWAAFEGEVNTRDRLVERACLLAELRRLAQQPPQPKEPRGTHHQAPRIHVPGRGR